MKITLHDRDIATALFALDEAIAAHANRSYTEATYGKLANMLSLKRRIESLIVLEDDFNKQVSKQ